MLERKNIVRKERTAYENILRWGRVHCVSGSEKSLCGKTLRKVTRYNQNGESTGRGQGRGKETT